MSTTKQTLESNNRQSCLSLNENIYREKKLMSPSLKDLSVTTLERTLKNKNTQSVSKNVLPNNLYTDILFQILNDDKDLSSKGISSEQLIDLLRNAFDISIEKHENLLRIAKNKNAPTFLLNVGIIKLKDVTNKDLKGVLGHFVTVYMQSDVINQYYTRSIAVDSKWDEFFSFPLKGDPKKETLVIEVCKLLYTENNNYQDKPKTKNGTVVGELRSAFKKITSTPLPKAFKLMGKTEIPLIAITDSDLRVWYTFKKGFRKIKKRGSILIQINITIEKDSLVVAQEHQYLLMRILGYEQEKSNSSCWNGKPSIEADEIITQHYVNSGLSENVHNLMKWVAYTYIHENKNLPFHILKTELQKIIKILPSLSSDCIRNFWGSIQRIFSSCFEVIWKIRDECYVQKQGIEMLIDVLSILKDIESLSFQTDDKLLMNSDFQWLNKGENNTRILSIRQTLEKLICESTTEWLTSIKENSKLEYNDYIEQTTYIIQRIYSDMERAIDFHHKYFYQIMQINYARILYECYKNILLEYCRPTVIEASRNLVSFRGAKVSHMSEFSKRDYTPAHMELFEIYLGIKKLVSLGSKITELEEEIHCLAYYEWFSHAVPFWVETVVGNSLFAIKKALDLDNFEPIDENIRHSSSVLDTLSIFYQIKIFWEQLEWPSAEVGFIFLETVLDGLCRCCTFYASKLLEKISHIFFNGEGERDYLKCFEINKKCCIATCNIKEMMRSLSNLTRDMGLEGVIGKMKTSLCPDISERCAETVKNIVFNCQDTLENDIQNMNSLLIDKIIRIIQEFAVTNIDSLIDGISGFENLFVFLDKNASIWQAELAETDFDAIIETLQQKLLVLLHKIIQDSLYVYRPPSYYENLRKVVDIMIFSDQKTFSKETDILLIIQKLLNLYASKTETLIHECYKDELKRQNEVLAPSLYGQLTVKANFSNKNILCVNVLNGKNICSNSSRKCPSTYVKLQFIPSDKFLQIPILKTAVRSKTVFPLYDENFKVNLNASQLEQGDNIIVFTVKAQDYFKTSNHYLSECYVSFKNIRKSEGKQMHLNLFRVDASTLAPNCIRVLEYRQFYDKTAYSYINKLKERSGIVNNISNTSNTC